MKKILLIALLAFIANAELSKEILYGDLKNGGIVNLDIDKDEIKIKVKK